VRAASIGAFAETTGLKHPASIARCGDVTDHGDVSRDIVAFWAPIGIGPYRHGAM
jgi:hypothetical protein